MSEVIHCNGCGYTGPNEDNGHSASDLMDQLEAGEIEWDEYQELLDGSRFACPSCQGLDTEVAD